jgi:alpha-1,6-mannosyltransferase
MLTTAATVALAKFVLAEAEPASPSAKSRHVFSLALLTASGVIFRSELAVLVAMQTLYLLITNHASLKTVIWAGLIGLLLGLNITVAADSLFWQKYPTWPEWTGFYFNTILGKSSEWGTSPWHHYFANALPRLLLNPISYTLLIPLAVLLPSTRQRIAGLLLPQLLFVALYSILPHKEWRFIVYSIPSLTAVSAVGASWVWTRRQKSLLYRVTSLGLIGSLMFSFAASLGLLAISRLNYPGGEAITRLHGLVGDHNRTINVHADNLACQTGVTRFLESRRESVAGAPKWKFDKTENDTLLLHPLFWDQFDYAIVERQEKCIGMWEVVDVVTALDGVRIVGPDAEVAPETDAVQDVLLHGHQNSVESWNRLGETVRKRWTRGWWITLAMQPKIKILKRTEIAHQPS